MYSGCTYFCNINKRQTDISSLAFYISVTGWGSVPMWVPVGVQKWRWDVVLQLDDSEPQCGHDEQPGTVNWAVPFEVSSRGQAELVREVSALVMVLSVLVLVERQSVGAILVLVGAVLAFLTQAEVGTWGTLRDQVFGVARVETGNFCLLA